MTLLPAEALAEAQGVLHHQPVFIAGSVVAAESYGLDKYGDLDIFVPSEQVLISTVQSLLDRGYVLNERYSRVWWRWLRYGFGRWHTNSIKLESVKGVETNVVYKLQDGHPTTSLGQVLESFDFGLLAVGWDAEAHMYRDLRPYLFPGMDPSGPLPMMPDKQRNWVQGFISQYNGLREGWRYGKYAGYGYDMSLVAADLTTGYRQAAAYHATRFDSDKQILSEIYSTIADRIDGNDIDDLVEAYQQLDFDDPLDQILDALS